MADKPEEMFESANSLNPLGPYQRRELKVDIAKGIVTQDIHIEVKGPDGDHIIHETRYLCMGGCGVWVTFGADGYIDGKKVFCPRCFRRERIKRVLKPLWSPFIKTGAKE